MAGRAGESRRSRFRRSAGRGIVRQNLIIAGAVKGLLLLMALLGVSFQLWFTSFIDVAAGLFCILNANRAAGSREKL